MHRFRHEWTPSADFTCALTRVPLVGQECRYKVETLTQGRAVLLAELPDRAIARLQFEFPGVQAILVHCREQARARCGTSDSPHRYLPRSVTELAFGSPIPWAEFAALGRKGSWLEVLSLQGPISAAGAGVALEALFQEDGMITASSARALGIFSFEERCIESNCEYLIPRLGPQGEAGGRPLWDEVPSKRLRGARSMIDCPDASVILKPIDLAKWRFP